MTLTPTKESSPATLPGQVEVLIKEARRRGRRHQLAVGLVVLTVLAATIGVVITFGTGTNRKTPPARTKGTVPVPVVLTNAPRCTAPALLVAYEGTLEGAGSWNELLTMRNASGHACSLAGFPSVRFLTSAGSALTWPIAYAKGGCTKFGCGIGGLRYHGAFPRAILAAHTGVASFFIEGVDIPTWGPHQPHPTVCTIVPKFQVALPHSSVWHNVNVWSGHSLYPCGGVAVLPLVPGRSGTYPSVPLWTILGGTPPGQSFTSTTVGGTQPPLTTATTIP
jgi:hypothetical protein